MTLLLPLLLGSCLWVLCPAHPYWRLSALRQGANFTNNLPLAASVTKEFITALHCRPRNFHCGGPLCHRFSPVCISPLSILAFSESTKSGGLGCGLCYGFGCASRQGAGCMCRFLCRLSVTRPANGTSSASPQVKIVFSSGLNLSVRLVEDIMVITGQFPTVVDPALFVCLVPCA